MKNYKLLPLFTGLFVATLLLANILNAKLFTWWIFTLPAGIIIFPLAFLFGDILTEVYGYAVSRKVIWTGFAALILAVLTTYIARILPPASFWGNQEAFDIILGNMPRIVFASMVAYFLGEFCNSYVIAKMKLLLESKAIGLRFIASTAVGEAVDTVVFVAIAFIGTAPLVSLIPIVFSAWIFKVVWEIIALPISIPLVKKVKQIEHEDFYDTNTIFNPFRLK